VAYSTSSTYLLGKELSQPGSRTSPHCTQFFIVVMLLNPGRDVQGLCGGSPPEKSGKRGGWQWITCYNVMPLLYSSIPGHYHRSRRPSTPIWRSIHSRPTRYNKSARSGESSDLYSTVCDKTWEHWPVAGGVPCSAPRQVGNSVGSCVCGAAYRDRSARIILAVCVCTILQWAIWHVPDNNKPAHI
jgi:hypothetical protein